MTSVVPQAQRNGTKFRCGGLVASKQVSLRYNTDLTPTHHLDDLRPTSHNEPEEANRDPGRSRPVVFRTTQASRATSLDGSLRVVHSRGATLMDPWNGSGTTTSSAALNGCKAIGFDLNPVMAVVAKARLLPQHEIASIAPLLTDILNKAALARGGPMLETAANLVCARCRHSRSAHRQAIYRLLVSATDDGGALDSIQDLSSLAAFFCVALFGALRSLLHRFKGSNPTWITRPRTANSRTRPATPSVGESFARLC